MIIFVIIDHWFPNIGGGPVHVYEIAKKMRERFKAEVTIVTSRLLIDSSSSLQSRVEYENKVSVKYLGETGSFFRLWDRLVFVWSLFFFLLRSDFDILHVHPHTPLIVAKLVGVLKRKPVIISIHAEGKDSAGLGSISWLLPIIDFVSLHFLSYDGYIFVSKQVKDSMYLNKPSAYIPNGVDWKYYDKISAKKSKIFRFLYVGRFHPQKNLITLIEAFADFVNKRGRNAQLLLIGSGQDKDRILLRIAQMKLTKNVRLVDPLHGRVLVRAYKQAHIFVLPSRYEGFPLTILEAWASRLPVIGTPVGSLQSLICHGINGFLTTGITRKDIAHTLELAYKSKTRTQIGENGYKLIQNKYSWDACALKTYRFYENFF